MRHTTFRFALNPTPVQELALARHAGAARFGYNQSLRMVTDALAARKTNPHIIVPWSRYDLINAFNSWKQSEAAGRMFVVAPDGTSLRSAAVVVAWYTDSWVDLRECVVDRCARVLLGGGVVAGQELVVASSMILLGGSSPRVA
jgi:putative transposase